MWSIYDTFVLITGLLCIVVALIPARGVPARTRATFGIAGMGIALLSLYTGSLTSFSYPSVTFAAPFLAVAAGAATFVKGHREAQRTSPLTSPDATDVAQHQEARSHAVLLTPPSGRLRAARVLVAIALGTVQLIPFINPNGGSEAMALPLFFAGAIGLTGIAMLPSGRTPRIVGTLLVVLACLVDAGASWLLPIPVTWLWTVPYGLAALAWMVARGRPPRTLPLAAAVPVIIALLAEAYGALFAPVSLSGMVGITSYLVVGSITQAAVVVAACVGASKLDRRERPAFLRTPAAVFTPHPLQANGFISGLRAFRHQAQSSPFVIVTLVGACVVVWFLGAGLTTGYLAGWTWASIAYALVLLIVGTTRRRAAISTIMVAVGCVAPAVIALLAPVPVGSVASGLRYLGLGTVVLAWQIARRHTPAYFLVAAATVVTTFALDTALTLFVVPARDSPFHLLVSSVISAAVVVGACWISRRASRRNSSGTEAKTHTDASLEKELVG